MILNFVLFSFLLSGAVAVPSVRQNVHGNEHDQLDHHTSHHPNNSGSNHCAPVDRSQLCLVPLKLLKLNITEEQQSAINDIKNLFDFEHLKAIIKSFVDDLPDAQLKCEACAWLKQIEPPPALKAALTLTDAERAILQQAKETDNFTAVEEFMQKKMAQLTEEQKQQINEYFERQRENCQGITESSDDKENGAGVKGDPGFNSHENEDAMQNINRPGVRVIGGRRSH
uniref:Uncharacterized protein n=1 Tax=Plectus sambesii TaxID=2011161 RepID=A0A914WGB9_9BILA